jgi:protocatechuate 3,4-dioxygenase beta subunit
MRPASPSSRSDIQARRRLALGVLGSLGLAPLVGCGGGGDDASGATDTGAAAGTCTEVPQETAGPYPADGSSASNRSYNVLALSGIVRSDIRYSIGSSTPVGGVPLTLTITLTGTRTACAPLSGYAIYLWHCTQEGDYSVYTEGTIAGTATFTTVVPGCYAGRMPHMHLEIYPSLAAATTASNALKTTQLAFPTDVMGAIYNANAGYSNSVRNLASISFQTDNVFSDGYALEMTSMQADASGGYTAAITIAIAA